MNYMELKDRLKHIRTKMGITQADFAILGGVRVLAQHNYEQGIRLPSLQYLLALRDSGIKLKDICYIAFGEVPVSSKLTKIENEILYLYQNTTEERKKAIEFVAGLN